MAGINAGIYNTHCLALAVEWEIPLVILQVVIAG